MAKSHHTVKSSMYELRGLMSTIEHFMKQSDREFNKKESRLRRDNLNDTQIATVNSDLVSD